MAAAVFLAFLGVVAGLVLIALTDAFRRDARDHRGTHRPESDR